MNSDVHVLALVTEAFGGRGGVAAVTRDFTCALARLDEIKEIELLPLKPPLDEVDPPKKVLQRPARSNRLHYVIAALQSALMRRPRLIYCDHLHLAPLAAMVARMARAPLVVHLHGIEIWSKPSPLRRRALESAALLVCVSRDTRKRVLAFVDAQPERAFVLNNTCDVGIEFVGKKPLSTEPWAPRGSSVLLTVGRLSKLERYKGHEHVIDAMVTLRARGLDATYVVAGDGDDRERLEVLARDRGVARHVRFLGQVPRAELLRLYSAARAFVMPSSGEGFGIVFLEAMMLGTPAVGLAVAGATDALANGSIGITTTLSDLPDSIVRAMSLTDAERRLGAARTRERFGRERFERQVAGIWRHLTCAQSRTA